MSSHFSSGYGGCSLGVQSHTRPASPRRPAIPPSRAMSCSCVFIPSQVHRPASCPFPGPTRHLRRLNFAGLGPEDFGDLLINFRQIRQGAQMPGPDVPAPLPSPESSRRQVIPTDFETHTVTAPTRKPSRKGAAKIKASEWPKCHRLAVRT